MNRSLSQRRHFAGPGQSLAGPSIATLLYKATKQVGRASSGTTLSDYRSAEDATTFYYAPTSMADVHAKAAYWLAVASRLARSKSLALSAAYELSRANLSATPAGRVAGLLAADESATGILADAGKKIAAVDPSNPQLKAVAAILGVHATQAVAAAQRAWEASSGGAVIDAVKQTAGQIAGTEKRPWTFYAAVIGIPLAMVLLYFGIARAGRKTVTAALSSAASK